MSEPAVTKHLGKITKIDGIKLNTECSEGKLHCHTLTKDAKVTHNGNAAKLADLKVGAHVRVTPLATDNKMAIAVEAGKSNKAATAKV
jgi:hypothetical protein